MNSKVQFFDCSITDTRADNEGGFAYVNQASYLEISSSTSISSTFAFAYSIVAAYNSELIFRSSNFQNFNNTGIFGNALIALSIDSCSFSDSMSVSFDGGAVKCNRCESISITNSKFINSTSPYGGAINISNERRIDVLSSFIFHNNNFYLNQAVTGGAIFADNSNIHISGNSFRNNSAGFVNDIMGLAEESESGGAIRLICKG